MAMFTMNATSRRRQNGSAREAVCWSLGDTRHLGCQNTLISNTPPCAAWRGITDTPVIARCRPRTMSPGVPPRSSRVHRPSPGRIRRALRDATARPASYPHRTPPGRGGEVLTQQSNGGGDHVDRLNDEPLGKPR